jgi:hypothetical protein
MQTIFFLEKVKGIGKIKMKNSLLYDNRPEISLWYLGCI